MAESTPHQHKPKPSWFDIWVIALATIMVAGVLTMVGTSVYALPQRAEPLPDFERPKVHHDGIYPAATNELTQPIRVTVANRHRSQFHNAVVSNIEQSGGRVKKYGYRNIEAVAPASYVAELNNLRDNPDRSEYRNGRYVLWTQQFAAGDAPETTREHQDEWTAFNVNINTRIMPNRTASRAMYTATITTIISLLLLTISYGARADIAEERRKEA